MFGIFAQAYWFGAGLVRDIGLVRELCWLCLGLPGRNDQFAVVRPAGDHSCHGKFAMVSLLTCSSSAPSPHSLKVHPAAKEQHKLRNFIPLSPAANSSSPTSPSPTLHPCPARHIPTIKTTFAGDSGFGKSTSCSGLSACTSPMRTLSIWTKGR
jgi:hypothetical protein